MTLLLFFKLSLVPSLVVGVTLAGRRWGAAVAGGLAAFPVVAGPILIFVAIEQGAPFAASAAVAASAGVLGNIAFGIAYAWVSRKWNWFVSLLSGWCAYTVFALILNAATLNAWMAASITVCGLIIATRLYPADPPEAAKKLAPSDLPFRVVAALALVLAVTFFSETLGPKISGLLSVFPVMGSVLAVFSHRNINQYFAAQLLLGMVRGFFAFTAFCFVLATTLPIYSIAASFILALVTAVVLQSLQMFVHARLNSAPASP